MLVGLGGSKCARWAIPLLLGLGSLLFAQGERTTITGTVADSSKAIIPGAAVTIRNTATNIESRTTTNNDGLYYITSLPPGTYDLSVEKQGFSVSRTAGIPLTVGLAATVDVTLQVGNVSQNVVVTANAVQLEAQTSALQSTITTRSIAELPNIGRNPLAYAALVPGNRIGHHRADRRRTGSAK
jgi:hypothetical protein